MADFHYFQIQHQQDELTKRKRIYESLSNPSFFTEWLNKFESAFEIGKRGLGEEEPLIKFLHEYTGLVCGLVDNSTIHVYTVSGNVSLPSWVIRYLTKVTDNGKRYGDPITTKECIDALE